ncbi:MAG TPA: SpoIIE family protein phosphatase [Candidatus Dormibacteraeota bacterium]|jgi:serine phosphatase RsbU (regulator of sigma subunit)/catechol 2,3-dioxygenase-like lactoylglutathione lyase family enzyme|nr:SpoIIE family protein phosphatase [Candidatus Dormibacteraeota bacterium]
MEHSAHPEGVLGPHAAALRAALLQPFLRLNFVTLWVRDQERSRQFFVEKLSFEAIVDLLTPDGGRWIVVAPPAAGWLPGTAGAGFTGIALCVPPEGAADNQRIGQNTGFSFLTEDVRSVFEAWSRRGVRFPLPPTEPSWGAGQARYALFEDVDGNSFSLIEFDEATRALEAERRVQAAKLEAERQAVHDLAIAKQVQTRLFPQRQPLIRTLVYSGICHPARTVGGDYYDFLDLGSRRLGLVIADIAGKGIGAALLMANLQAALRSQCATAWEQPERFLRSVNQLLYENTADGDYATLFFAEYDDDTRRLRYSNCGHPPALLLRGEDGLERLGATCTVVGLFDKWDCAMEERQLAPGDAVLLYTDGVTEARNDEGEEFGEQRLLEASRQHRELSPPELLAAVADQARGFSPHEQADDITLIVANCT